MDAILNMWYNFVLLITQPSTYFDDRGSIKKRFIEAWILGGFLVFTFSALQTFETFAITQATFLLQLAVGAGLIFLIIPATIGGWTSLFYVGIVLTKVNMSFAELLRVYLKTFPLIVLYWSISVLLSYLDYTTISLATTIIGVIHTFWLVGLGVSRHEDNMFKSWVAPWSAVLLTSLVVVISLYIIEFVIEAPTY